MTNLGKVIALYLNRVIIDTVFLRPFLAIILVERVEQAEWRAAILIGGLGAFTTFSTFSIETQQLILTDQYTKAALNALLSVVLCVGATWFGMFLAKVTV